MENLIVFNDVNLIGKDNNNVFSTYATKYFLYLIDDYSVMDEHTDFLFEKKIVYFKENKYKTGFLFDDYYLSKNSVIGFSSYNFNTKKTVNKYLIYLGLYTNEAGKKVLVFVGNNGIPFESEAEVFTFRQKNMDDLNNCTSLCRRNENGEIIERWQLQNMEDKNVPF